MFYKDGSYSREAMYIVRALNIHCTVQTAPKTYLILNKNPQKLTGIFYWKCLKCFQELQSEYILLQYTPRGTLPSHWCILIGCSFWRKFLTSIQNYWNTTIFFPQTVLCTPDFKITSLTLRDTSDQFSEMTIQCISRKYLIFNPSITWAMFCIVIALVVERTKIKQVPRSS